MSLNCKSPYPLYRSPSGTNYRCILYAVCVQNGWEWYGFEKVSDDIYFGFVEGDFPEFGTFSTAELSKSYIDYTTNPADINDIQPPIGWTRV